MYLRAYVHVGMAMFLIFESVIIIKINGHKLELYRQDIIFTIL